MIFVDGSNIAMNPLYHAKLHCWYMKPDVCTVFTHRLLMVLLIWQILIWFLILLFIAVAVRKRQNYAYVKGKYWSTLK